MFIRKYNLPGFHYMDFLFIAGKHLQAKTNGGKRNAVLCLCDHNLQDPEFCDPLRFRTSQGRMHKESHCLWVELAWQNMTR